MVVSSLRQVTLHGVINKSHLAKADITIKNDMANMQRTTEVGIKASRAEVMAMKE